MKSTTRIQKGRSLTEDITGGGGGAGAVPVCITISDFCLTCNKTPTVAAAQHASSPRAPPVGATSARRSRATRRAQNNNSELYQKTVQNKQKPRGSPSPPTPQPHGGDSPATKKTVYPQRHTLKRGRNRPHPRAVLFWHSHFIEAPAAAAIKPRSTRNWSAKSPVLLRAPFIPVHGGDGRGCGTLARATRSCGR